MSGPNQFNFLGINKPQERVVINLVDENPSLQFNPHLAVPASSNRAIFQTPIPHVNNISYQQLADEQNKQLVEPIKLLLSINAKFCEKFNLFSYSENNYIQNLIAQINQELRSLYHPFPTYQTLSENNNSILFFLNQMHQLEMIIDNRINPPSHNESITTFPSRSSDEQIEKTFRMELSKQVGKNWNFSTDSYVLMINRLIASNGNWSFTFVKTLDLFKACNFLIQMLERVPLEQLEMAQKVISELIKFFSIKIKQAENNIEINRLGKAKKWFYSEVLKNTSEVDSSGDLDVTRALAVSRWLFTLKVREFITRSENVEFFKNKDKCTPRIIPCYVLVHNPKGILTTPLRAHFNKDDSLEKISSDINKNSTKVFSILGQVNKWLEFFIISLEQFKSLQQIFKPTPNGLISALLIDQMGVGEVKDTKMPPEFFWQQYNTLSIGLIESKTLKVPSLPPQPIIEKTKTEISIASDLSTSPQNLKKITSPPLVVKEKKSDQAIRTQVSNQIKEYWTKSNDSHVLMVNSLITSQGNWCFNFTRISDLFKACDFLIRILVRASLKDFSTTQNIILELLQFFRVSINVSENEMDIAPNFNLETKRDKAKHWFYTAVLDNTLNFDSSNCLTIATATRLSQAFFSLKVNECIVRFQNDLFFKAKEKQTSRIIPCYLLSQNHEKIAILSLQAHFNADNSLTKISSDDELKSQTAKESFISLAELKTLRERNTVSNGLITALFLEEKKPVGHFKEIENVDERNTSKQKHTIFSIPTTTFAENPLKRSHNAQMFSPSDTLPTSSLIINSLPFAPPPPRVQENRLLNLEPPQKKSRTNSSNGNESIVSIQSKTLKNSVEMKLSAENFWEQFNTNSIASIESNISNLNCKQKTSINYGIAIDYPILNRSSNVTDMELVSYYPSIKSYQLNEISKIINAILKGVSRVLAFEMGLGKTLVYISAAHQLLTIKKKSSLVICPKSLLMPIKEEFIKYFETACGEAWRISWLKVIENPNIPLKGYVNSFILVLQKFSNNTTPFLRALFSIAKDHFDLLNQSFESHYLKMRTPISFVAITEAVEKHLNYLNASYKSSDKLESILGEIKKAINKMQERLPSHEDLMQIENLEETLAKNILNTGNLDHFPLWNSFVTLEKKNPFITLALCEFAGALLEIDPDRIVHSHQKYDETDLQWLKEINPNDLIVTSNNENELLNALNSTSSSIKSSPKFFLTTVQTAQRIPSENFTNYPLASIIVDEAQKAHTIGTLYYNWLLKTSKNKHSETSMILVSGTPLENNFGEMMNLLTIANSSDAFPNSIHNDLEKLYTSTLKVLLDKRMHTNFEYLEKILLQSFGHFDNLRNFIVNPFFGSLNMSHPKVKQDWNNLIPTRQDIVINVSLSAEMKAKLTEPELQSTRSKKDSIFKTDNKIVQLLFGIDAKSLSLEDKDVEKIVTLFKSNNTKEKENYIREAPTLNAFIESDKLTELIQNREKAIVFTQHRAIAKIIKCSIQYKFGAHIEIKIYHGELNESKRNNAIKWFKRVTASPKIIILMEQVGGVGLNLQEANYMFKLFKDYNPAVEAQADARLLRVNSEGIKQIISFQHGLLNEARFSAIQFKKQKWINFFWNENPNELKNQFKIWCEVLLAECHHAILNNTKNVIEATETIQPIRDLLGDIFQDISSEKLQDVVNALAPKIASSKSQPTQTTQVETSTKILEKQEELSFANWFILPLPPMSMEDLIACHFALKTVDKNLVIRCDKWLKNDPNWANVAYLGIGELTRKTPPGVINPFVELYKQIFNRKDNISLDSTIEIYGFSSATQVFKKMNTINANKSEVIRICEYSRDDKKYHDLILPR